MEQQRFSPEEAEQYEDSLKIYRDLKNSLDTAREEGREEGIEQGKALNIIELLQDGDISFTKAKQKIDKLKSRTPDAHFWPDVYQSLNSHEPGKVKEPTAKYRTRRKTPKKKKK
jgi:hypothetical protein